MLAAPHKVPGTCARQACSLALLLLPEERFHWGLIPNGRWQEWVPVSYGQIQVQSKYIPLRGSFQPPLIAFPRLSPGFYPSSPPSRCLPPVTVRAGQANSHAKQGWEQFTDAAIRAVVDHHGRSGTASGSRSNGLFPRRSTGQLGGGLEAQGGARDKEGPAQGTGEGQRDDGAGDARRRKQCPVVFLLWGNHAKTKAK